MIEVIEYTTYNYWQWLLVSIVIITILQFRVVTNLLLLSLWPARYPILAVVYVAIFLLYLIAKALDPRAADFIHVHMVQGDKPSFPLMRFIRGVYLSIKLRKLNKYDFPGFKKNYEANAILNSLSNGHNLGTVEDRVVQFVQTRNKLKKWLGKYY